MAATYRGIAQPVEQWSPKPRVVSSILTAPAIENSARIIFVFAVLAQLAEHFLGKEEVGSSNLLDSSKLKPQYLSQKPLKYWGFSYFCIVQSCVKLREN